MKDEPLVSVLMTVYNREKYLAEAIESALSSNYEHFELIIVDDCSIDQSVAIARKYESSDSRINVYVNENNLGDYLNRNKAASYAKGKYLKYLDADDRIYYYGLEVMVNFTELFPEAGFGLGAYPEDSRAFPILLTPREIYLESFGGRVNHFDRAPGSGLIKKDVFDKMGGFSGKRMIGDYEFWFKVSRYYSMVKLPLDLYWNRIHSEQESKSDFAIKNYESLRKEVLIENLRHPDCPLSVSETEKILQGMHIRERKEKFLKRLSKLNTMLNNMVGNE
jgi:glycosyltransferase involved in cell wall biosynthesis